MAATPKHFPPYPRRPHARGQARITVSRKSYYLGPHNSQESIDAYERLRDEWRKGKLEPKRPTLHAGSITLATLVADFLAWSKRHQAEATHNGYAWFLHMLTALHGERPAQALKIIDITRWIDSRDWGPTTANNAQRASLRVMSWGVEQGLLSVNPLKGMKKTRPQSRQRGLTEAEYRALLRHSSPVLRRMLFALRHTGARPKELRELTWDQVQTDRIVLTRHKTSSTQRVRRDRVIWLVPAMRRLLAWMKTNAAGPHVFANTRGLPWTRDALVQAVGHARDRAGVASGAVAYSLRHSFITAALVNGVGVASIAALAGNSVEMVAEVYSHIADDHAFLAAEMERATRRK